MLRIFVAVCSLVAAGTDGWAQSNASVPMVFEQNRGQNDAAVRFSSRGPGDVVFIGPRGLSLVAAVVEGGRAAFRMDVVSIDAEFVGEAPLRGRLNYFLGQDSKRWVTGVETFERVRARRVWPDIDMVYRLVPDGRMRFDFELETASAHQHIALRFPGATGVESSGRELLVHSESMTVRLSKLVAFQSIGGQRVPIEVRFVDRGKTIGFALGDHDPSLPLTIDPTIDYTTYLGGDGLDALTGLDIDPAENVYVSGHTVSLTNFYPTTVGAYQTAPGITGTSAFSAVVSKIDPSRTGAASLVYSTFMGGTTTGFATAHAVRVSATGRAYVVGDPSSTQPTTANAQQTCGSQNETFVAILSADGSTLDYSSCVFVGGTRLNTVAVHPSGDLIAAGTSSRLSSPIAAGGASGLINVMIVRINPSAAVGSQFVYEGHLGGNETEALSDIVLDASGRVVIMTPARAGAPVTAGVYQSAPVDTEDVYLAKIDTNLPPTSSLVWGTYIGGPGADGGAGGGRNGLAIDAAGNLYGGVNARNFPTTPGVIASMGINTPTNISAVVFKMSGDGRRLIWSTYLDLSAENVEGIDIGPAGEVVAVGRGIVTPQPLSICAVETVRSGAYIGRIDSTGTAYEYLSYIPAVLAMSSPGIYPKALRVGGGGTAYVTGHLVANATQPIVGGAQTTHNGAQEGFVQVLGTTNSCNQGPCGNVTFEGSCSGTELTFCQDAGTAFEQLMTVDCATGAFPTGIAGVCTLIDPVYGYDCAVAQGQQCNFRDAAGDDVFGLCDGATPACVVDPRLGRASCVAGVGTCDEATFVDVCAGDYLLQSCQVVQPVAFDCTGLGGSCSGARCIDVAEGMTCDSTTFLCENALVCHGPTDSCQQPSSICEPAIHQNQCEGAVLLSCDPRTELITRIDCSSVFSDRGSITCAAPYSCIDGGSGRCAAVGAGCVATTDDDLCDVADDLYCGRGRSCVYGRGAGGAVEGRCTPSSAFTTCTVGDAHVGCQGDIATFCVGVGDAVAVEPQGFDCAAVGAACSVVGDEPVCVGAVGAGCQDPGLFPSTLYRCGDGLVCDGAIGAVLGTCIERQPTMDAGTDRDTGMVVDGSAEDAATTDAMVASDGGVIDSGMKTKIGEEGCGCSNSSSRDASPAAFVFCAMLAVVARRRRLEHRRQ